MAVTDGLTGLCNHRHFQERLVLEAERSTRNGLPLALLMVDVDHFKNYNDHNGHQAGDEVLRRVAQLLADGRRANDICARYGGEEFSVVLVDTSKLVAAQVATRLVEKIAATELPNAECQPKGRITASIGVATFPGDANDSETLIRAADAALYRAKAGGRNRVALA
ncbi:MAG: GGDEF domain-containing protein [Pseudomonadota bacterium]